MLEQLDHEIAPLRLPEGTEIVWLDPNEAPFSTHGVYYSEKDARYVRMPLDVAASVKPGYDTIATWTAGGRIRFVTDSDFIAISVESDKNPCLNNTTLIGSHGFGLYADGVYQGELAPVTDGVHDPCDTFKFSAYRPISQGKKEITLYFPLYNGVIRLYVGVAKGASVCRAPDYAHPVPIVFYGSSITEGGGISHPGNEYTGILSRRFNADYINLGFSGTSKGEAPMAEYLASHPASIFFIDYDSSDSEEEVEEGILRLWRAIRRKHPHVGIVFTTRPDFLGKDSQIQMQLRNVNLRVAKKMQQDGDDRVYAIDALEMIGEKYANFATSDNTHPNDLGHFLLAQSIGSVFEKILK